MLSLDCYHHAVAYLLALDRECSRHINDIFDFDKDCIIPSALSKPWQTGTSRKTTRLLFNLWNGYHVDYDITNIPADADSNTLTVSRYYAVDEIFCCLYAPFYYEAIKLRYPEYTIM